MTRLRLAFLFVLFATTALSIDLHLPEAAKASAHFDARVATDAWLATVAGPDRKRSDAYFEGGYWLILWDFLSLSALMLIILEARVSAKLRDYAIRVSERPWVQAYLYWIAFAIVSALLLFPLTIYESFVREHSYGLSNQDFGSWLRDELIGFALVLFTGGVIVATIMTLVKRLPRSWHVWGAAVMLAFVIFSTAVAPIFVAPLFNTYTPLKNARIKAQILSLAHATAYPSTTYTKLMHPAKASVLAPMSAAYSVPTASR